MEPVLSGARSTAQSFFSGAFALAKGILHPTTTLKASLSRLTGLQLPRSSHSLAVVKGRAYVFGGEVAPGKFASNDVHVVILPSSAVLEPDYQRIPARSASSGGELPAPRKGHTACVVGDSMYVYGGQLADGAEEPNGRVWVFDTMRRVWSFLDPPSNSHRPPPRERHAVAAIDLPAPAEPPKPNIDILPQAPPDPAKFVPEPPQPDSYGTMFVHGGMETGEGAKGKLLNDTWAFDIRTRSWMALPTAPTDGRCDVGIAVTGDRLYRFGGFDGDRACGGDIESVDVSSVLKPKQQSRDGLRELELKSLTKEWMVNSSDDPESTKTPGPRSGAALIPVTTVQGRNYLLLLGGVSGSSESPGSVWVYHLSHAPAAGGNASDAAKQPLAKETERGAWAEIQYQYVDASGDEVPPDSVGSGNHRGIGIREHFAASKGTEVDGATAVVWGGLDGGSQRLLNDGWMVTVDV